MDLMRGGGEVTRVTADGAETKRRMAKEGRRRWERGALGTVVPTEVLAWLVSTKPLLSQTHSAWRPSGL